LEPYVTVQFVGWAEALDAVLTSAPAVTSVLRAMVAIILVLMLTPFF
jgi:hypothetical protein